MSSPITDTVTAAPAIGPLQLQQHCGEYIGSYSCQGGRGVRQAGFQKAHRASQQYLQQETPASDPSPHDSESAVPAEAAGTPAPTPATTSAATPVANMNIIFVSPADAANPSIGLIGGNVISLRAPTSNRPTLNPYARHFIPGAPKFASIWGQEPPAYGWYQQADRPQYWYGGSNGSYDGQGSYRPQRGGYRSFYLAHGAPSVGQAHYALQQYQQQQAYRAPSNRQLSGGKYNNSYPGHGGYGGRQTTITISTAEAQPEWSRLPDYATPPLRLLILKDPSKYEDLNDSELKCFSEYRICLPHTALDDYQEGLHGNPLETTNAACTGSHFPPPDHGLYGLPPNHIILSKNDVDGMLPTTPSTTWTIVDKRAIFTVAYWMAHEFAHALGSTLFILDIIPDHLTPKTVIPFDNLFLAKTALMQNGDLQIISGERGYFLEEKLGGMIRCVFAEDPSGSVEDILLDHLSEGVYAVVPDDIIMDWVDRADPGMIIRKMEIRTPPILVPFERRQRMKGRHLPPFVFPVTPTGKPLCRRGAMKT
ncbi:hypothetical protein BDK51DRAFT_29784 [Blyttiomyces helicus]|uniref:Uncharacterized protein n=1 Tax=Blyttiomyces helicus TaxID=388810 RepID=A0A4V1IRV3_9FUNG|nr:hypothetical protein BDK51DRAFT_29784 [Blyttiomyces helicus]|eukprot:RKO91357.1 hypothetical protein BDK51DRAFT_29784 [Blyttiomyces helicus]